MDNMSSRELAMPARYYNKGSIRASSIEGILRMTQEYFVFAPYDPMACAEVNGCFNQIICEKVSGIETNQALLSLHTHTEGQMYFFGFGTFSQRDVCRDFAERVLSELKAMQSSLQHTEVSEKPAVTIHDVQLTAEEKERRLVMLARYYNKGSIRGSSIEGILRMTQEHVVFTPNDPTACAEVNECFNQIKCEKVCGKGTNQALLSLHTHTEGQMYIFGFGRFFQRNVCRDFAGRVLSELKAMQSSLQDVKVSETPAVTIHDVQLTAEEKEQRLAMPVRYYYKSSIRASSIEGVLRMTQEHFKFTPYDPTACAEVNVCFNQIKFEQVSRKSISQVLLYLIHKEGQMYIFGFGRLSQRDVCRDFAGRVLSELKAMQSSLQDTKVSETPAVTIHNVQLTEEKERRLAMPSRYYYKGSIRASSIEGILRMTQEHLVFTPYDPTACAEVNECFNQIKCEMFSKKRTNQVLLNLTHKKGQMYIFGFDRFSQRDVCRDFAGRVLLELKAIQLSLQDTKVSETPVVTIHDVQLTAEEKERRMNFPLENNELLKQHKQFVTDGMLTEAEDWAPRKVSGLCPDESQVEGLVDDTKDAITTISTRKRALQTKEEDFDAEEWEFVEAEN